MANHPNRSKGLPPYAHVAARAIAYEETGDGDWSELETAYGGGGYRIDREKLAAQITIAINEATKAAHAATAPAWRDLNVALQMIRDAVEELGPVAACSVSRDQFEPRPIDDAEAVIAGILKMKERTEHKVKTKAVEEIRRAWKQIFGIGSYQDAENTVLAAVLQD